MSQHQDYGYLIDHEESKASLIAKKCLLVGGIIFSILCFIFVTINAYHFVYHGEDNNVKTIKSPDFPIKVIKDSDSNGLNIKDIDKTIYENILGRKNEPLEKENIKIAKTSKAAKPKKERIIVKDIGEVKPKKETKIRSRKTPAAAKKEVKKEAKKATRTIIRNTIGRTLSRVQIAALSSQGSAEEYWKSLNRRYPGLFSGHVKFIQKVNLGRKGVFYRLQVGNFRNQIAAENFCLRFIRSANKNRTDCIVVE